MFETHLDVLLMNDRYKEHKVKPFDSIKCDEEKIEDVSDMYEKLAKEVIEDKIIDDETFEDSYEHMCKIEKLLYSKRGIKKGIVNFLFKKTPFNTMMHPLIVKDNEKIDYLNLTRKEWKDPSTETVLNKSFYDLIEEAKKEASEWIELVIDSYEGKKVDIERFTKGFIYDGHKVENKMKVFKNVYEKGEESK